MGRMLLPTLSAPAPALPFLSTPGQGLSHPTGKAKDRGQGLGECKQYIRDSKDFYALGGL